MKKIIALAAVFAAVQACPAQHWAYQRHGEMITEGRPFFTDAARYNSYELAGSPLGLFDADASSRLSLSAGYGYYGMGDEGGHYLNAPTLRWGQPGRAFFEVFYGPDILSHKNSGNKISMAPLHRFGLTAATQTTDGFFRSSIMAKGYIGGQEWQEGDSSRAIMGVEALRLDMGSQLHPLVRLGLFFNVTARLDTLKVANDTSRTDRSFQMNLPEFGGNIDFGGEGMPVRSNLSVSYAFSRSAYTIKPVDNTGILTTNPADGDKADPIMNDSLRIMWLVQGTIPITEEYILKPGLLFGISNNSGERRNPHEDNDPFQPGEPIPNTGYSLSGTHLGIGAGFQANKYADIYIEYAAALMSLDCESAYAAATTESRNLHRTSFGVSTPLHKYLTMPINLTPRISYFIAGTSGYAGAVHSGIDPLNVGPSPKSKASLYMPNMFLAGFERTSGFTFGVDGGALEERLSASFWMTFLSQKSTKDGGLELGLSVGFTM